MDGWMGGSNYEADHFHNIIEHIKYMVTKKSVKCHLSNVILYLSWVLYYFFSDVYISEGCKVE